jgi:hypothetical protein
MHYIRRWLVAGQLWVREIKRNKIRRDVVVPCALEAWTDALAQACHDLDLQVPVILPRHERDWQEFRQARFVAEHFLEDISFDRLEAEYFDPDEKRKTQEAWG